ncbi:caspase family protein [Leeuwenhoekiella parthenopeia]|uniref:Caspase family protein n=1 Tax=Leeuwenhoekiella parthenopeia TaxID=2890320 RepID=A0ABS8GXE5_9FLAO|nr:caspase family protein [Leeuwenhoekiella parthenopeia]MCC4214686.1 caspase family protein [Leeuwenhoekiella parthenopeia]
MLRILLLSLFFVFSFSLQAKKIALIIAVGDYPASTGWSPISSANDVPLIKSALIKQGFTEENISILLNSDATRAGIISALENLNKILEPGDIVVIHYSGHGQQIADDNGEEIDDKDEALVPYDAFVRPSYNYSGQNHIRDDELGKLITNFRNKLGKDGQLMLLLDSCHSGSATRGGKARGGAPTFAPEGWSPSENKTKSGSDMLETAQIKPDAAPFVLFSGASANELNYEYEGVGSLSYAFNKAMTDLGSDFTYRQLYNKMAATMNVISPNQTPTIEGNPDYKVFKGEYVKQEPYYEILSLPRPDVVKIQAGKLQGIFPETTVAILPAGTTTYDPSKVIAKGTVKLARFNEANIVLDKALPGTNAKEYWVFIDNRTYGDISLQVYLDASTKNSGIQAALEDFLSENNLGKLVQDSLESSVIISENQGSFLLKATNGEMTVDQTEDSRGSAAFDDLRQKLFNYAQGQYLKDLQMNNPEYEFSFRLLPVSYDVVMESYGENLDPNAYIDANGMFSVVPEVDHVVLEVTNESDRELYFSIIEINSRGEITPFMPNDQFSLNDNERKLAPGQTMVFKDYVFTFGPPYEKLMLKGFAAPNPINFKATVQSRGESSRGSTNPLESFLANTYTQSRGGNGAAVSGKLDGFATEFVYQIVEERK